ncbi:MAG: SxtJ family membrane protein, partial [Promethearchaeota archaeon]
KTIKRSKKDIRNFGIVIFSALFIAAGFLFYKGNPSFFYFILVAFFFLATAFAFPAYLKPLYLVWMTLAHVMGWVMSRIILSVLFYGVLTPISLILRLFNKQFLDVCWDKKKDSYWKHRTPTKTPKNYEKQF